MPLAVPADVLGLIVSGDINGMTVYTDRHGRKVYYEKAPPTKPPSALQTAQRNRFKTAQANYQQLTLLAKLKWEVTAQTASLCMTGQNLFIALSFRGDQRLHSTMVRQTKIQTEPPPLV